MKRDKTFVVFIVFISFAVTGVLHYMRSPEMRKLVPYLSALESSLSVFGDGSTNEFYSFGSELKPGVQDNILPIDYFVEEQRIIEEFSDEQRIKPILFQNQPTDYISFYMSLTSDMSMYNGAHELKTEEEESSDTLLSVTHQSIRIVNNNHRITHKIRANDNLYNLAKKYYNDVSKWVTIYQANKNKMPDPHSLQIGQELIIPDITVSSKEDRGRNRIIKT